MEDLKQKASAKRYEGVRYIKREEDNKPALFFCSKEDFVFLKVEKTLCVKYRIPNGFLIIFKNSCELKKMVIHKKQIFIGL